MTKIGCVQHDCDHCKAQRNTTAKLVQEVNVLTAALREQPSRNDVLEEVAQEFDKMKVLGDTAASFAAYVRGMKT